MGLPDMAKRLKKLPFYLYPTIERATEKAKKGGRSIIDLSTGEPEFGTPAYIINSLQRACENPMTHRYGNVMGYRPFREAIARWYKKRFNVNLDPEKEVITFVGSKEGIAFLPQAFIEPGDIALIPDPGYPTYRYAAAFASARLETFPLRPENSYVPDLSEIPEPIAAKAKMIFLNYPNNPTGATVEKSFFEEAVLFAKKFNLIICHDAAYSEVVFDGYRAPSLLEIPEAKDVGVEVHTLSKTYCMTGWRLGFAVGNEKIINALLEVKRVSASGHFTAMEIAGTTALETEPAELNENNARLRQRRDFVIGELQRFGIEVRPPRGSFYIWFPVQGCSDSLSLCVSLILNTGVVTFPGIGYGENGEGYLRIATVQDLPKIEEAFARLEPYLKEKQIITQMGTS